jgi:hypothetical protein
MTPKKKSNDNNCLPAPSSGSGSTRWRAIPTRAAIKAGRASAASEARSQKCDRLCRPQPTAIQSATRKGSKKTTAMITKPLKRFMVLEGYRRRLSQSVIAMWPGWVATRASQALMPG